MRKIVLLLLISVSISFAQKVSVQNIEKLIDENAEFYYPQFSPDGSKILLTSANYKGLWIYDLEANSIEKLNDYNGAGYNAAFTKDGSSVVFRSDEFEGLKKYSTMMVQNLNSKEEKVLQEKTRNLSAPDLAGNEVVYVDNNQLQSVNVEDNLRKSSSNTEAAVFIENQKMSLYQNGEKKVLAPLGEGNYIWASVSPDQSKLLFNLAGQGTYISDLDGNILYEIGYANAPKWSDNSKYIVFMKDYDDGQIFTASEIYAYSLESQKEYQLTESSNMIEMYPVWKNNKIAFNTGDGQIYLMDLKID